MECSFFSKRRVVANPRKKRASRANSFSARAPFASSLFGWDEKEDRGLEVANSCGHDDRKYPKNVHKLRYIGYKSWSQLLDQNILLAILVTREVRKKIMQHSLQFINMSRILDKTSCRPLHSLYNMSRILVRILHILWVEFWTREQYNFCNRPQNNLEKSMP